MIEPFEITTSYDERLIAERFYDDDRIFVTLDDDAILVLDRDQARGLAAWMLAATAAAARPSTPT